MKDQLTAFLNTNNIKYDIDSDNNVRVNTKDLKSKEVVETITDLTKECSYRGSIHPESNSQFLTIEFNEPKR